MDLTILDAVLVLFLLCGAVLGFKKGAIKSLVGLVGTIAVIIIAFYLKNPVAEILYKFVPFFQFSGSWEGLVTLNILVYEGIAYIIVFGLLSTILNILLKITGVIEKVLTATIILGIPSKIIGAVLGFVEAIFFAFIILFVLLQFNVTHNLVNNSSLANSIISKTPIVGTMVDSTYKAIKDITGLTGKYNNQVNKDAYNGEILSIMLDYELIKPEVAQSLIDSKKLEFGGVQSIVNKYKEEKRD